MGEASRGVIAIRTGAFAIVAVGSIAAVLANNAPVGAGAGVAAGVATLLLMWPRKAKTDG